MQAIIVNEKNREKIESAIIEGEGKSGCRTIDFHIIETACVNIEKKLNVPKKYLEGVCYSVDWYAQTFPNCYYDKGKPESTHFTLTYEKGKWRVSGIERNYTRRNGHMFECRNMPEATKQAIICAKMTF